MSKPEEVFGMNYTEKVEYAKKLVKEFIQHEYNILSNSESRIDIYDTQSFMYFFMTIDMSRLTEKSVRKDIEKRIMPKDVADGTRQYAFTLARMNRLVTDMTLALGSEFMDELRTNLVSCITRLSRPSQCWYGRKYENNGRDLWETVESLLTRLPTLLISALGSSIYMELYHKAGLDKQRSEMQKALLDEKKKLSLAATKTL